MKQINNPGGMVPFQVKLLGIPTLEWQGQNFSLARKQARALLYMLGETLTPISRDQISFIFWADTPETAARRNLSRLLSYIRNSLPNPEIIQVHQESIRLNPALTWSDTAIFIELAGQSSPSSQQEMVALYSGLFLSGFDLPHNREYDSWLTIQRSKYEDLYLSALKNLIQVKFANQDIGSAIDYAQRYLAIDEVAEDIHQELIRLHAARGDRSAAMRQFETCTVILERELGVEPLPETRAVYDQARSGDSSPLASSRIRPTWTVLPSLDLPLIGRQTAWNELEDAYLESQRGGMILLSGEPGIGKSRLLQEYALSKDRLVLSGNCYASTQALPYQPLAQALRQAIASPQLWQGIKPIWLTETGRLLPELGEHFPGLPALVEVEPDQAQARLNEGLTQSFLGLARNTPLLFCLDDLQWVDEATVSWLTYLSGWLADSGLCILGTYRTEGKDAIADLRSAFRRNHRLAEVRLAGLNQDAIQAILEALPDPPPQPTGLAEKIGRATGGNSFFVLETIRMLLEDDLLGSTAAELPLAGTVQDAIHARLERLSPVARQILEAAAVLEPDLGFETLLGTAGRSDLEITDGLDELVDHQLLIDSDPHRFKHDLISQVAYLGLSPWRRQLLHRRAAEVLAKIYLEKQDESAAQIARHYHQASKVELAAHYYYRAGIHARRLHAYEEAIAYLQRSVSISSSSAFESGEILQYYELLGDSLIITGQYEAARQVYSDGLGRIPESDILERVKFQTKLADVFDRLYVLDQAASEYDKALRLLNSYPDHQELAWQQAWLEIHLERWGLLYKLAEEEKMEALQKEIKPVLDKVGNSDQKVRYYSSQVSTSLRRERYFLSKETVRISEKWMKVELEIAGDARAGSAKFRWGFLLLWSGDLIRAQEALSQALALAEETGRLDTQCRCLVYLTCLNRLRGDVTGARSFAQAAFAIAEQLGSVAYIGAAYGNLAWIDWRDQKFERAEQKVRSAISAWGDFQYPFKWLAYWVSLAINLDRNQLERAVQSARRLLDPKQQRLPEEVTDTLDLGVHHWEAGKVDLARNALGNAIVLAHKRGYL